MPRRSAAAGFTLVELILVIIVIGVLAVIAVPRLQIGGFEQYSFDRELRAALRHAQKVAIASACEVEVDVGTGGYSVRFTGEGGEECDDIGLRHPTRSGPFAGEPEGGASIISVTGDGKVRFNSQGGTGETDFVIVMSGGRQIVVEAETGYVHGG